jgi:hypothetical protein
METELNPGVFVHPPLMSGWIQEQEICPVGLHGGFGAYVKIPRIS